MRKKYTLELLQAIENEYNIELLDDYSKVKIRCDTTIKGKCIDMDCKNTFKKGFKNLLKNGPFCTQCCQGKGKKNITLYNLKLLKSYCDDNSIILNENYSNQNLNKNTRINGICKNIKCENSFDCTFSNFIGEFGALCTECFYNKRTEVTKETNMKNHGVEYVSQVPEFKEKAVNTMLDRYGVKYTTQSPDLMNKMKQNNNEKYGYEYVSQVPEFKEKIKDTNMNNHGVTCSLQRNDVKEKTKETNMKNHGVECVSQVPEIREKAANTMLNRYGFKHAMQSPEIQQQTKETNMKNYGVEYVLQVPEFKEKAANTMIDRYGFKHAMQSPEIRQKATNTIF